MGIPKYIDLLESEYQRRKLKNPSYSLRGFALAIGLSQTALLKILKEKNRLSEARAELICKKLNWSQESTSYFLLLILHGNTKSALMKTVLRDVIHALFPKYEQNLSTDFVL